MAMRVQTGFHGSRHRGLQSSHTLYNDRSDVCYTFVQFFMPKHERMIRMG
ncbi:hypothetical protein M758_2G172800 [Ceratodon purpureus]|nr:hypothetical protein M758_2G172800 [Ceratodon purpureus]